MPAFKEEAQVEQTAQAQPMVPEQLRLKFQDLRARFKGYENVGETSAEIAATKNMASRLDRAENLLYPFPKQSREAQNEIEAFEKEIKIYNDAMASKLLTKDSEIVFGDLGAGVKEHLDDLLNSVFTELAKGNAQGAETALAFYKDGGKAFELAEYELVTEGSEEFIGQEAKNTLDGMAREVYENIMDNKIEDAENTLEYYKDLQGAALKLGERKLLLKGTENIPELNEVKAHLDQGLEAIAQGNVRKAEHELNQAILSGGKFFTKTRRPIQEK